ncbi:MAG: NAD-dependent epimerase/dehydratase family protein [Planctomycetes bacterium]|nr:NAD-dependent epimerase/dehydratase family protein [Planctomycetota bacterium]
MRALVTGGAGFLGSCLVDRLLAAGWITEALDDLSQGSLNNLRSAFNHSNFNFQLGSVLDNGLVGAMVERADYVFHLAALVGIPVVLEAGRETLRVNAKGSYTVLRACAARQKRCILFSSSEVYGNGNGSSFSENHAINLDDRGSIRWLYAAAKACSERAAQFWFRKSGLPVTTVRPFNATGPKQSLSSGQVVPVFVHNALRNQPLRVFGNGEQRRTFVSGEDLVDQVIDLAMDERTVGRVYNVGGVENLSINELAHLIREILHSSSPVVHVPYEKAYGERYLDIMQRKPDLTRLNTLGYGRRLQPLQEIIEEISAQNRDKD